MIITENVCPLFSIASAAAGGTFAECRRGGCALWDAAGLCCCLRVIADSVQQTADGLRTRADKKEADQ